MIRNQLEYLLTKNDMTITELSKAIGISRNSISNLINNNSEIQSYKTDTLNKICSFFQVGIEEFLIITESPISIVETTEIYALGGLTEEDGKKIEVAGTMIVEDRFNHKGQFSFSITLDFSSNANIIIEKNKIPLAIGRYSISNEIFYDINYQVANSFTDTYYISVMEDKDNYIRILTKILHLALIDNKTKIPTQENDFCVVMKGFSASYKEEINLTFLINYKLEKAILLKSEFM